MGTEEVDDHVTEFGDDKPVVVASEKSGQGDREAQVESDGTEVGTLLGGSAAEASVPQAEREVEEPYRGSGEKSSEEELVVRPANGELDSASEEKEGETLSGSVDIAVKDATAAKLFEDVVLKIDESDCSIESTSSAASNSLPETLESSAPITEAAHEVESAVSEVSKEFPNTAVETEAVGKDDSPAVETEKSAQPEIAAAEEPTSSSKSVVSAKHQVPFVVAENVAAEEVAGHSDNSDKDLPVPVPQNVSEDAMSPVESISEVPVEASENDDEKELSLSIENRSEEASSVDAIEADLTKESERSEIVDTRELTSMHENTDKKAPAQAIEEAPQLADVIEGSASSDIEAVSEVESTGSTDNTDNKEWTTPSHEDESDAQVESPVDAGASEVVGEAGDAARDSLVSPRPEEEKGGVNLEPKHAFTESSAKALAQTKKSDDADNSTFNDVVRVSMDQSSKPVDEERFRLPTKRYEEKMHPLPQGDEMDQISLTADVEGEAPSSSTSESAAEGNSLAFAEVPKSSKPGNSDEGATSAADWEAASEQPEFADREVSGAVAHSAEEEALTTDDGEVAATSASGEEESSSAPLETFFTDSTDKVAGKISEEPRIVKPQGSIVDTEVLIATPITIRDEASSMLQTEMTDEEAVAASTEKLDEGPPFAAPVSVSEVTKGVEGSVTGAGEGIDEVTIGDEASSMLQTEMRDEETVAAATETLDEGPPFAAPDSLTNGVEDSVTGAGAGTGEVTIGDEAASMLQTEMTDEEAVAAATGKLDEGPPFVAPDSVSEVTNGVEEVTIGDEAASILQTEMTDEAAVAAATEKLDEGPPFATPESASAVTKGVEDTVTRIGAGTDEVAGTAQDEGCPSEVPGSLHAETETPSNPEIAEKATRQTEVSGSGDAQESTVNDQRATIADKEQSEWVDSDHSEVSAARCDLDAAIVEPDSEAIDGATKVVTEEEGSLQPESIVKGASSLADGDALRGQSESVDREESSAAAVISGEEASVAQPATVDEAVLLVGAGEGQPNLLSLQAKSHGEVASNGAAKSINEVTRSVETITDAGTLIGDPASYLTPERTDKELKTTAVSTPVSQKGNAVDTLNEKAPVAKDSTREAGTNFDEVTLSTPQQPPVSQEVVIFDQTGSVPDDTTALITSTQPSHGKDVAFSTPPSYNLDEVASNLYATAEKALEQTESSGNVPTQNAIVHNVAQIVLEQSKDTVGSSKDYIAGVVQKVAGFAHEASQSTDPNILPDTVARVFDGEATRSSANRVTQPEGTASLGTMVSLFVIWCVSLCTSHMESKDLPAPALKLAAEEVASVLNSSAPTQSNTPQEVVAASTN